MFYAIVLAVLVVCLAAPEIIEGVVRSRAERAEARRRQAEHDERILLAQYAAQERERERLMSDPLFRNHRYMPPAPPPVPVDDARRENCRVRAV